MTSGCRRNHHRRLALGLELDRAGGLEARREIVRDLMEAEDALVVWDAPRHQYRLELLGSRATAKRSPWDAIDSWAWNLILKRRMYDAAQAFARLQPPSRGALA